MVTKILLLRLDLGLLPSNYFTDQKVEREEIFFFFLIWGSSWVKYISFESRGNTIWGEKAGAASTATDLHNNTCQILVFHLVAGQITQAFEALFPHWLKTNETT